MGKRKVKIIKDVTYDLTSPIKPIKVLGIADLSADVRKPQTFGKWLENNPFPYKPAGVTADLNRLSGHDFPEFAKLVGEDLKTELIAAIDRDITKLVEQSKKCPA